MNTRNLIRHRIGLPPLPCRHWPLRLYAVLITLTAVWLAVAPAISCLDVLT